MTQTLPPRASLERWVGYDTALAPHDPSDRPAGYDIVLENAFTRAPEASAADFKSKEGLSTSSSVSTPPLPKSFLAAIWSAGELTDSTPVSLPPQKQNTENWPSLAPFRRTDFSYGVESPAICSFHFP